MHVFTDVDIFDLVAALDDKAIRPSGNAGLALVSMLCHLLGGEEAMLELPPLKRSNLTRHVHKICTDRAEKHAARSKVLKQQCKRALGRDTEGEAAAALKGHRFSTSTDLLNACVAKLRGVADSSSEAGVVMDDTECAADLLSLLMTVPTPSPVQEKRNCDS